jgi:hypothetical protein
MSVDLRGFDYALEPVRCRWQWQLDALQVRLGKLEGEIRDAEAALAERRSLYKSLGEEAGKGLLGRFDPDQHRRRLTWLAQLRGTIAHGETELAALKADRAALRLECRTQQTKVELIHAHRDECVAEFAGDEARRLAAQADRDWLARQSSIRQPSVPSPEAALATEVQS